MPAQRSAAKTPKKSTGRLATYRAKRDFSKTPEPPAKIGPRNEWRFAVQRHEARRLHFDLRLELDGVLKSWAVAKGISMVPGVKRLAVETEDHPLDYLTWEGVIPKGEYGGGTMIVWDRGTWLADGDPREGLKNGKLIFALNGERLKGHWHFVRMKRRPGERQEQWLLFKGEDDYSLGAGDLEPAATELTSVISGLTNEDLAERQQIRPDHKAREKIRRASGAKASAYSKLKGARKSILPVFVEPALAEERDGPPQGKGWLHEIKHDGYRMQARLDGGKVKLLTRTGLDWTKRFPTIAKALAQLPVSSALLDGEIVAQEDSGISTFTALQTDLKSGRRDRLVYFMFDLLYCEGVNLAGVALADRKAALEEILRAVPGSLPLRYSAHMDEGDSRTIFAHACQMGLEGLLSKRADAPYRSGRGDSWIKSKCALGQEFVIIGYVPSTTSRQAVGSLVLGFYDGKELVHAGRAGTGFTDETALALRSGLATIETEQPKFKRPVDKQSLQNVRWVEPRLVADIQFRGWSPDKLLRQAAFKGLREDKAPKDVKLEIPQEQTNRGGKTVTSDVKLTHPDRILWPEDGITKQGLAEFYTDIAEWILPHITGRVLSLVRCPGGVGKSCFYAKHIWDGADKSLLPVDIGEAEPMLAIRDLDGLIALVQANVLEIHPWGSRVETLEKPDRIIFDLDPGEDVAWEEVIEGAFEVRERLKKLRLESFVKTTGGKGLHVVAPISPAADWDRAKDFTRKLAEAMATDTPRKYLAVMTKARRKGRIFVDYLRNGRGATAVAAYSTRARKGAAVSVPLTWSELETGIRANHFSIDNLRQRLSHRRRDAWAGFFELKQKLPKA
ncbi:DNA ligase D [Taklimakanibacter albus]|uniref:DNA ligase D n=1 Tax=Taklimakanibacter albus TaxID=2800327 RepID=A0ACC5RCG2_9HYPH|nr:DNA ligase D [Aestuariivirga sp. YIM B02566]MBK1870322.1 DNA ligase D [Aestuariivirga sp. YIM B02566]